MSSEVITAGSRVRLHFSLVTADGELIDSNFAGPGAELVYGDGSLPGHFEQCLLGLVAGDRRSFQVLAEQGFGEVNPANRHSFSRDRFDSTLTLEEGLVLSFTDPGGGELPGVVVAIEEERVWVDFNHPLAGMELIFEVEILAVENSQAHGGLH